VKLSKALQQTLLDAVSSNIAGVSVDFPKMAGRDLLTHCSPGKESLQNHRELPLERKDPRETRPCRLGRGGSTRTIRTPYSLEWRTRQQSGRRRYENCLSHTFTSSRRRLSVSQHPALPSAPTSRLSKNLSMVSILHTPYRSIPLFSNGSSQLDRTGRSTADRIAFCTTQKTTLCRGGSRDRCRR